MCGILGIIGKSKTYASDLKILANHAVRRGSDSSGIMTYKNSYSIETAEYKITSLVKNVGYKNSDFIFGIGRLITNGNSASQPYLKDDICVIHNGIIVNDNELFNEEKIVRNDEIDTEIIAALVKKYYVKVGLEKIHKLILAKCKGTIATAY